MARHSRRGFTLVEMLIVITIMLVLMGIGVVAYRHIETATASKATNTRLEMCVAIMKEYDATAGMSAIEGAWGIYPPTGQQRSIYVTNATTPQPGDVSAGSAGRAPQNYPISTTLTSPIESVTQIPQVPGPPVIPSPNAVQATGMIFQIFQRVPNVRTMLNQLPASAMLQSDVTDSNGINTGWLDASNLPMPVIVDGWKNPIIYVPSGGLAGVIVGGPLPETVDLSTNPTALVGHSVTVKSVDGRPFFASAGPDGNFRTGDDNVYSCPVVFR